MPLTFNLRRAYDRGYPIGASKVHLSVRGRFSVAEQRDDQSRRQVLAASFDCMDGQPTVPVLREVKLLSWNGTTMSLTGVEEIRDDNLGRPQRLQQTWIVEPDTYEELARAERVIGRLVLRLRQAGIEVWMLPGGEMLIPGETWPDGTPRPEAQARSI